jgi:ribonucleoside-triphosphate reductase
MNGRRFWKLPAWELKYIPRFLNFKNLIQKIYQWEYNMRSLEDIDKDLAAAREALYHVEGTTAEVYSRIVGYYRSVRNWNKGKREEYGERRLYNVNPEETVFPVIRAAGDLPDLKARQIVRGEVRAGTGGRVLLFVRPACPACPSAKEAARRLGLPVDYINADTEEGLAEAVRRQVQSTPTAILLTKDGEEVSRAWDPRAIASFGKLAVSPVEESLQEAASM